MANTLLSSLDSLKVAIYIRVSTHWQIDKDSLQVQKRELIAYCEMVLGIKDYILFEDPGYSAKNTERPDYQRMMERLRTGEFSHLLVWKIDRISRNLLDFATMYDELKKLGVTFVSKNEQFDTSSAIGEAMLKIILIFAELERNMTSERVTAVMLSRANNSQWNGGRVPYGYVWDKQTQTFSLHPAEINVQRMACNLYEEYQSLLYVSRYLNDRGYRTRSGKEWSLPSVHKLLTNPFYVGDYVYNVHKDGKGISKRDESEWIVIPDHHEPSITREQFDRITFLLKRNKRGNTSENFVYVKDNIHIFAGLVKCGICGSNMSATIDRRRADGWRPSIYGCSKRRKSSSQCTNKYVSDAIIGPFIFNYVANIIRAHNSGKAISPQRLSKLLLKGKTFTRIDHIEEEGLIEMSGLLSKGESGLEYKPEYLLQSDEDQPDEHDLLLDRKRKYELALNRLKSLYLFGDSATSEAEYIIERDKLIKELQSIEARLSELQKERECGPITDDDFIRKASYFVMVEKLLDDKFVDYEKYIRAIEPSIPKNFIQSIIDRIEVTNGDITSITFKNGMVHKFIYK